MAREQITFTEAVIFGFGFGLGVTAWMLVWFACLAWIAKQAIL